MLIEIFTIIYSTESKQSNDFAGTMLQFEIIPGFMTFIFTGTENSPGGGAWDTLAICSKLGCRHIELLAYCVLEMGFFLTL